MAFTSRGECRLSLSKHAERSADECGENDTTYSTSNTDKQSKRISAFFFFFFFFLRELELEFGVGVQNKTRASQDPDPVFVWDA